MEPQIAPCVAGHLFFLPARRDDPEDRDSEQHRHEDREQYPAERGENRRPLPSEVAERQDAHGVAFAPIMAGGPDAARARVRRTPECIRDGRPDTACLATPREL